MGMEPFIGEVQIFGFNFAPVSFALCAGQTISIAQNSALFALLGTTYGGDGIQTFKLPDLRGRVVVGMGAGPGLVQKSIGEMSGTENVTLLASQMPAHTHTLNAGAGSGLGSPVGNFNGASRDGSGQPVSNYTNTATGTMNAQAVGMTGSNQPHSNMQPYTVVNYCIALEGIFPSRN